MLLGRDQLSVLEDPHVLLQAGQRHAGRCCQLADRRRTVAEPLENGPPGRVGQRGERAIYRKKLNHTVQYDMTGYDVSTSARSAVTVVQFRAVAVTPSPLPASAAHSFDRATPAGCHA